jgi:formate-dependent nitrite reductase membrane component NrfD
LLGPLFLLSGLSAGAALMHILTEITGKNEEDAKKQRPCMKLLSMCVIWLRPKSGEDHKLTKLDNVVLMMEFGVICLFFIGLISSSQVAQDAAQLLLTGSYAAAFWCFVVILGILVPLLLQFLQSKHRIQQNLIPAIMVLGGGLALRFIILYAGQASHW